MVAIQGTEGSFHYQAAQDYFGSGIDILECRSFDAVVKALLSGQAQTGVMAIENSIAGAILPNYALIDRNNLYIAGEYYMNIQHHLMALPGQTLSDITEVHSHYMALLQCKDFFEGYPQIKLVEATNTAQAAKEIETLAEGIQTIKQNATRFVVLTTKDPYTSKEGINKATLKFQLYDQSGSLATVLNVLRDYQINMTKIQSLPVIDTPWKYAFFVEGTFPNYQQYKEALRLLEVMSEDLKVLGEYQNNYK